MHQTTVTSRVRLTIPPDWRVRVGGPFCNNMFAEAVGPDPDNDDRMIVKVDGTSLRWPKEHVHTA